MLDLASLAVFDLAEMGVEVLCPLAAQSVFQQVQQGREVLGPVHAALSAGVEMAEVDAGQQSLVQLTDAADLLLIAQNVDLAHGLDAHAHMVQPFGFQRLEGLPQVQQGVLHGNLPLHARQAAAVDHDAVAPQPVTAAGRFDDIFAVFGDAFLAVARQIDIIGGVEGHDNALLLCRRADGAGGVLAHVDAPATLIFITVQPHLPQPLGRVDAALIGFGKAVAVAGGAKKRFVHSSHGLSLRKGSSASLRGQKYHR